MRVAWHGRWRTTWRRRRIGYDRRRTLKLRPRPPCPSRTAPLSLLQRENHNRTKRTLFLMIRIPLASPTPSLRAAHEFVYRAGPLMGTDGRIASYDAAVRRRRAP